MQRLTHTKKLINQFKERFVGSFLGAKELHDNSIKELVEMCDELIKTKRQALAWQTAFWLLLIISVLIQGWI